jgi:hypothetical protein
MTRGRFAAASAVAVVAIPALALAEQLPPHSSYYDQHANQTKPVNDVSLLVYRKQGKADVYVYNYCLGSQSGEGGQKYPNTAGARGVKVHKGKIAFDGKATIYMPNGQKHVAMKFKAKVERKKATGTAKFPGTSCGTVAFKAKLVSRTK